MPRKKKSATRRGNNEGSIYQRKDGLWIAQVTIGVKEDGKIARKSFTGKSRAEVAEKIIPYLNKNKGQVVVAKEDVTIGKHLMFWLMCPKHEKSYHSRFWIPETARFDY